MRIGFAVLVGVAEGGAGWGGGSLSRSSGWVWRAGVGADESEGPVGSGPSLIHPAATGGSVVVHLGRHSAQHDRQRRWPRPGRWLEAAVGVARGNGCARWHWRQLGASSS